MDDDGFQIPKSSIQPDQTTNSPSPPPPTILTKQTKKRKRDPFNDECIKDNNSKKLKLSITSSIYSSPSWAELPPTHYKFELEVIKNGVSLNKIALNNKTHFIFGRDPQSVDILTLHPSCSRNHAVLQHRKNGQWFLFDFGSTHFTKLNHKKLFPHKYYKIEIGNIIQFGSSQRMYILNGPKELEKHLEPQISPSSNKNKNKNTCNMESMIKQLAKQSKQEKIEQAQKRKSSKNTKINVWGIHDDIDDYNYSTNNEFDEEDAKQNIQTKELYKSLLLKRKQHVKLQNNLQGLLSRQRSDTELNQTQCIKIEKLRGKIDNLEDDIESISDKISSNLRGIDDGSLDGGYFDSKYVGFDDDDDYYDRIKSIRHKKSQQIHHRHALSRNARFVNNSHGESEKVRGYDSYKDELDTLEMNISEIEQTLRDIEYRKEINIVDGEKNKLNNKIDSILNDLRVNDNKYNTLKSELKELLDKKESVLKMVNFLKPAYFNIMEKEPERVNMKMKMKMEKYLPHKLSSSEGNIKIKPGSLADIAQKMKNQEIEKEKYEKKMETEAEERMLEREQEIKQAEKAKLLAMKEFEEKQKKVQERRDLLKLRDEENRNKVGLIVNKKNDKDNMIRKNTLESEFAKIIGINDRNSEDEDVVHVQDTGFVQDTHSTFLPPANQTGDGKTWLNEKYGY